MQISGQRFMPAHPDEVWNALHDVETLRDTLPGCKELNQTSHDTYTGTASIGIAVIKGLYRGSVRVLEENEASFLRVAVEAESGHAEIEGEGDLTFEPSNGGTLLRYTGDARIRGRLAALGQRLLPSASKSLTEQFFKNLERHLVEASQATERGG